MYTPKRTAKHLGRVNAAHKAGRCFCQHPVEKSYRRKGKRPNSLRRIPAKYRFIHSPIDS